MNNDNFRQALDKLTEANEAGKALNGYTTLLQGHDEPLTAIAAREVLGHLAEIVALYGSAIALLYNTISVDPEE